MAKFKPSLSVASASGPAAMIAICDDCWAYLEKALSATIPPDARAEIVLVTNALLGHAVFSEAETVGDASLRLSEVSRSAVAFWETLIDQNSSDARVYIDTLIEKGIADEIVVGDRKIAKISKLMTNFVGACNEAARRLQLDSEAPYIRLNEYWDNWIRALVSIFKKYDLATSVRKNLRQKQLRTLIICHLRKGASGLHTSLICKGGTLRRCAVEFDCKS